MLNTILGLFSQDLAVDPGTSNLRVHPRGGDRLVVEPSVVAIRTDNRNNRAVVAVGEEAKPMIGRVPAELRVVRPIRAGRLADPEAAGAMLSHLVRRLHGRNGWISPRLVVAIPHDLGDADRRALRNCCAEAGAREVHFVPRPVAAALGADLPVHLPAGHLMVDLGGGATEIAVVSMCGVVTGMTLPGGGDSLDEAVAAHVLRRHGLIIGADAAERLKVELGDALSSDSVRKTPVSGRCAMRGLPRSVEIGSDEICDVIAPFVARVADGIRAVVERSPFELASDIAGHGAVLVGGGALLPGLDVALRALTGLPVVAAEDPERAVAVGAGRAVEGAELLRAVAC